MVKLKGYLMNHNLAQLMNEHLVKHTKQQTDR